MKTIKFINERQKLPHTRRGPVAVFSFSSLIVFKKTKMLYLTLWLPLFITNHVAVINN